MPTPEQIATEFVRSPNNRKRLADLIRDYAAEQAMELDDELVALSLALRGEQHASLEAMLIAIKELCDRAGFNPAERASVPR